MSQHNLLSQPGPNMSTRMASSGRVGGDGMDFEVLHSQTIVPISLSPATAAKRHQNLNHTPKATLYSREPSPKYVPHEPVRGAVRPVNPVQQAPWQQPSLGNKSGSPGPVIDDTKKTKAALNAFPSSSMVMNRSSSPSTQTKGHTGTVKRQGEDTVKQVPVFNAPGHLSYSTYQSLNKSSQSKALEGQQITTGISLTNKLDSGITEPSNQEQSTPQLPPPEERQVEGQSSKADAQIQELKKQVEELEESLGVQLKVNGDLKKLLVASVGDDLHHKVESLVRTKAHLASEIGGYTQKIGADYESLDDLTIQADKWRTKYMAGRVLQCQLVQEKEELGQLNEQAEEALRQLLHERSLLHQHLLHTHRYLKLVRDSFDPHSAKAPPPVLNNDLELASTNLQLSEKVKFRLLGNLPLLAVALDAGIQNGLSPAESMAHQILANHETRLQVKPGDSTQSAPSPTYNRFHPQVRYDNITFNCCCKCKGDIKVV